MKKDTIYNKKMPCVLFPCLVDESSGFPQTNKWLFPGIRDYEMLFIEIALIFSRLNALELDTGFEK